MNKLRAAILLVSFWIMTAGLALAQTTLYTPNLHLGLPPAAPGTWGETYNGNFTILDTAVASGGVTDTTCPAGQKVSSIVAGVPTCTPTTLLNESLYLVGVLSPPQIVANTNDYAPANLGTASTLYINTDASRNLTGITGGATGRVLILYNNGTQNIVLVNESGLSSAINRLAINANITLGPAQGIIIQYDGVATRWRAASGVSGAGGQAADNDLTAIAALSGTGFAARTTTDTWAQRTMTGTANNISITNGDGIKGDPTIDVGANVALTSRSFAPTTGAWNFAAATSFTIKQATNYSPASDGMCGEDTVAFRLKCNLNGVVYTLAHLSEIQPLSTNLTAFSGLTGVNGRIPYFTGPGTMALTTGLETPCIDSGGQHLNLTAVGTFSCGTSSTGGLSGMTPGKLQKALSASTEGDSIIAESGGNITVGGGMVVGTAPFLIFDTSAIAITDKAWTIQNVSGTITPATGAFTNGHVVVATVAAGITTLTDGGVAGTGTWTDSSTSTGTNKTLVATGAGGTNAITLPIVASFDGGSITADGTNCQDPVKTTINSGPTQYVVLCATPASAQWDIMVPMLKQAVSTFIVRLEVNDTVSSSHVYAGTFKAQCRASGAAPSSTWGTTQTVSITMVTANNSYQAPTAAITANGTCSADSTLYVRFNASGSMTDTGTARVTGVRIFQAS